MASVDYDKLVESLPENKKYSVVTATETILNLFRQRKPHDLEYIKAATFIAKLCKRADIPLPTFDDNTNPEEKFLTLANWILERRAAILDGLFDMEIDRVLDRLDQKAKKESFGYAYLSSEEKDKIHARIGSIRKAVEKSSLNKNKKNAILSRLAELAKEVDLEGTRTDRFFSFIGDFSFVVKEMHGNAQPAIADIKEILRIVMERRAADEKVELPAPDEAPQLPSPNSKDEGE